jgi:hypothetical protein
VRVDSRRQLSQQVRAIALELAWRQWAALGHVAAANRPVRSIVDPEALLLLSLARMDDEARIARLIPWWASVGARLLSVQRAKNLLADYPGELETALGRFARSAVEEGGDHRWRSVAGRTGVGAPRRKDVGASPIVTAPPSLVLRLRLAFGVGMKADVLAYLLGMVGARRTVQQAARATRYYPRAVRRALEELAAARFVMTAATAPVSYYVDPDAWTAVLGLRDGPAPWVPWARAFPLIRRILAWLDDPGAARASAYLRSSSARDLGEEHLGVFQDFGVSPPSPEAFPGEAYLEPFMGSVRLWAERLLDMV